MIFGDPPQIEFRDGETGHTGSGTKEGLQTSSSNGLSYTTDLKSFLEGVNSEVASLYDQNTLSGRQINIDCNREMAFRVKALISKQPQDSRTAPLQPRNFELREGELLKTISTFLDSLEGFKNPLKMPTSNCADLIRAATIICYQISKDIQASRIDFTASTRNSLADFRLLHPLLCLHTEGNLNQADSDRNLSALREIIFKLPRNEAIKHFKKAALTVGSLYLKSSFAQQHTIKADSLERKGVFSELVAPRFDRAS